ncbi:MAG: hypothetical protein LBJ00_03100 [Planctomycetaceae bacterium]|nr:hypothetical protein [Planctomycetaceae bacterium]
MMVIIPSIDRKKVKHCSRPVGTEYEDISNGLVLITLCPYGTRKIRLVITDA